MTNKTMKLFAGLSSIVLVGSVLAACDDGSSNHTISTAPAPPNIQGCSDWEWDKNNQQWYCDDEDFAKQNGVSSGVRVFYYNGMVHTQSNNISSGSKTNTNTNKNNISNGSKTNTTTNKNNISNGSKTNNVDLSKDKKNTTTNKHKSNSSSTKSGNLGGGTKGGKPTGG